MKSMIDEVYDFVQKENRGVSSDEIVRRFFKIENVDRTVARRIVEPLLGEDRRFRRQGEDIWIALKRVSIEDIPCADAPYILFAIDELEQEWGSERNVFSVLDKSSFFLLYSEGVTSESYSIQKILREPEKYIFLPYDRKSLNRLKRIYRLLTPLRLEIETLSIKRLISHFFSEKKYNTWEDIIRDFSVLSYESEKASSRVRTLRSVFEHVLQRAREAGVQRAGELIEISNGELKSINFSKYAFGKDFLRKIPQSCGVYLFFNRDGQVIYVGKTKNLKRRISSYFQSTSESEEKRELILQHLYDIRYRLTGSDLEALIEEFKLIDHYGPPFNTQVRIPERGTQVSDRILVFPSAREGFLKLYFLSNSSPLIDFDYSTGSPISEILDKMRNGRGWVFDPLKIIALSYMKRYEENCNVVEIDWYGSDEGVVKALNNHWKNLDRLLKEKVTYL